MRSADPGRAGSDGSNGLRRTAAWWRAVATHVRVHVRDHEIEQAVTNPLPHVHPLAEVDLLRRVNPRADKAPFPLLLTCGSSLGACHHLRDEGVQHRGGRAIGQLRGSEGILIGGKVQLDAVNEVVVD